MPALPPYAMVDPRVKYTVKKGDGSKVKKGDIIATVEGPTRALLSARPVLEASGGVNLSTVRGLAESGVDVISIGALTHSAPNFDIGMDAA